jgi:hypothetical protein
MTRIAQIIIIAIAFLSIRCEDKDHSTISVLNDSEKTIYVIDKGSFPDTLIDFPDVRKYGGNKIIPHTLKKALSSHKSYEDWFSDSVNDNDTLKLFIFDAQLLETTPWDTVIAKYQILKRVDLSLNDLNRMNWTVTYP